MLSICCPRSARPEAMRLLGPDADMTGAAPGPSMFKGFCTGARDFVGHAGTKAVSAVSTGLGVAALSLNLAVPAGVAMGLAVVGGGIFIASSAISIAKRCGATEAEDLSAAPEREDLGDAPERKGAAPDPENLSVATVRAKLMSALLDETGMPTVVRQIVADYVGGASIGETLKTPEVNWGYRGDYHLLEWVKAKLSKSEMPKTRVEYEKAIRDAYCAVTGIKKLIKKDFDVSKLFPPEPGSGLDSGQTEGQSSGSDWLLLITHNANREFPQADVVIAVR